MADSKKQSGKGTPRSGQGAKKGTESVLYVLISVVVLVLANIIGYFVYGRADLTETRAYSLSQGSERLVSDLDDTMEITAYFSSNLPGEFATHERYVRNILEEYEAASGGDVRVRFVDPDEEEEREEAEQAGVREVQHQSIEQDSVNVVNGYRGLVIRYLGDRQTIPVIQDTQGLEYEISQAIRQLVREPLPVGVVSGHGSPTPTKGLSVLRGALPHYELEEVDVAEEIDPELRALLVVSPTEEFSEDELRRIDQYVMRGGSLGVFGGSMNLNLQGMPSASPAQTGLDRLLGAWGVRMGESLVADARCGRVPLRSAIGMIPVKYPPAPVVVFDDEASAHPVLFRLNQAPFFFTSPLTLDDTFHELGGTTLAQSTEEASWLLTGDNIDLRPRAPQEWTVTGSSGPHTMMVALEGQLPSAFAPGPMSAEDEGESDIEAPAQTEREVRVLVSGSAGQLRDEFLPDPERSRGQMTGGLALALNAVDWLAADADLIAIRAKNIEEPALDVPQNLRQAQEEALAADQEGDDEGVEEALEQREAAMESWERKKWTYRVVLIGGVPLLILLFGVFRWQARKNKRANLQELRKRLEAQKG
ncbi:MAG TPA: Gldg family protein [Sandaracinaceae bacterium LLY-WYZ-13_1]|nr:Gldg family protein [Sandaracinaceae bacterium LLY-WYZ-13_1]